MTYAPLLILFLSFLNLLSVKFFHLSSVVFNPQIIDHRRSTRAHKEEENMNKSVDELRRENKHQGVQGPVDQIESHRNKISVFPSLPCLSREPWSQLVLLPASSIDQGVEARGHDDATEESDVDKHPEWVKKLQLPIVANYWDILVKVLRVVKEFMFTARTNCFILI